MPTSGKFCALVSAAATIWAGIAGCESTSTAPPAAMSDSSTRIAQEGIRFSHDEPRSPEHDSLTLRGHNLFFDEAAAACASCHAVGGRGERIGPDLTEVARRLSSDQIREAIRHPDRDVTEGYRAVMVSTFEEVIYGRLVAESEDEVHILLGEDQIVVVQDRDIEEFRELPSIMPAFLPEHLADEDLDALVAFLLNAGELPDEIRLVSAE